MLLLNKTAECEETHGYRIKGRQIMKEIMNWYRIDERRTAVYDIQDILALKAPEQKTIHNLSVFHERFKAMELNLMSCRHP